MNDPILMARLRALRDDLHFVSEKLRSSAWLSEQSYTRAEMLVESLWNGLEVTLIKEIDRLKTALKKIEQDVLQPAIDDAAVLAAWKRYDIAFKDSQIVLRECLEIIGTLAIRNKDLDNRIWYVADELIRECLVLSRADEYYYLLVHTMEDTFIKSTSRILRLRFPEWTIWDLPLAAHELGHVIVSETLNDEQRKDEDRRVLEPFIQKLRNSIIGLEAAWNVQERGQWADKRVHKFLADVFATYTMGPAYAWSAILLRLNPSSEAFCERPSDAQRAQVILSMLEWADETASGRPYRQIVEELQEHWDAALDRVNPHGKLTASYKVWLKELAQTFGKEVGPNFLRRSALYPNTGQRDGWSRAQIWTLEWIRDLDSTDKLTEPDSSFGTLRDVLNATWFCRLECVKQLRSDNTRREIAPLKDLQEVGQGLCNKIMGRKPGVSSSQQIKAPSPGGRG